MNIPRLSWNVANLSNYARLKRSEANLQNNMYFLFYSAWWQKSIKAIGIGRNTGKPLNSGNPPIYRNAMWMKYQIKATDIVWIFSETLNDSTDFIVNAEQFKTNHF